MGESRSELLQWLNELLQTNITKIEQLGTGGAYCQVIDSIYGDVPMNRVKMNAKQEYEYLANYKVLQTVFKNKKIEKPVPVERLVKCKMQDNLEFIQWMKRFWDANYGGQPYDPVARRKGMPMETPATVMPMKAPSAGLSAAPARSGGRTPVGGFRSGSASGGQVTMLQGQLAELRTHLEGLEKERDFYFQKLRDIEILIQEASERAGPGGEPNDETLKEIQKILYSTEEGFEVPDGVEDDDQTF